MNCRRGARLSAILAACVLFSAVSAEAAASSLTLTLLGSAITFQEQATSFLVRRDEGHVLCPDATTLLGQYVVTRVVGAAFATGGSETITLVFADGENITLQGGVQAIAGESTGGVSAASARFAILRGEAYSAQLDYAAGASLTIDKLGNKSVNPCR